MLQGHSVFFLSQPMIYFGAQDGPEDGLAQEMGEYAEFQFGITHPFFPAAIHRNTGLYFDWYD